MRLTEVDLRFATIFLFSHGGCAQLLYAMDGGQVTHFEGEKGIMLIVGLGCLV
jgi:hypothetical protein